MLKRIFAVVSEKDFYAFQKRARKEGLDMGQAFASLTHSYALGEGPVLKGYRVEDPDATKPTLSEAQG